MNQMILMFRSSFSSFPLVAAALVAAFVGIAHAPAATVTYSLDLSVPNEFKVYAQTSLGDNGGIAAYGIPLLGPITSLDHRSPYTPLAQNDATLDVGTAGFSEFRTADGDQTITGSQHVIPDPVNLIWGLGQEASSFAAKGITSLAPSFTEGDPWTSPLLIATGTYDGSQGSVQFDRTNDNLVASVFVAPGSTHTTHAGLMLDPLPSDEPPTVDDLYLGIVPLGTLVTATLPHNDPDGDALRWSLDRFTGPSGPVSGALVYESTGLFSWDSGGAPLGGYSASITASDGLASDSGTLSFDLVPVVPNEPPTVDDLYLGGVPRNTLITAVLPHNDPDGDRLSWTLDSFTGPDGPISGRLVNVATGQFTWYSNSAIAPLGNYSASITASDGLASDSGTLSFDLVTTPAPEAGTVTFTLDLSVPNQFALTAEVSAGDNAGLAGYGVALAGTVLSLDHRSPAAVKSDFESVGFASSRSLDEPAGAENPLVTAWQKTFYPAGETFIYGLGQHASSFSAEGITPTFFFDGTIDTAWESPLVLATGTYDSLAGPLGFDLSGDLYAALFREEGLIDIVYPQVVTRIYYGYFLPEPATITLFGLTVVGIFGFVRRR